MKKITTMLSIVFLVSTCLFAQSPIAEPVKKVQNAKNEMEKAEKQRTQPVQDAKIEKEKTEQRVKVQDAKVEKDKTEQRMHAEEKSNGHAFSGKGKGGDKNLVDPEKKEKKDHKKHPMNRGNNPKGRPIHPKSK